MLDSMCANDGSLDSYVLLLFIAVFGTEFMVDNVLRGYKLLNKCINELKLHGYAQSNWFTKHSETNLFQSSS